MAATAQLLLGNLRRSDVDLDLVDAFTPAFPPPSFLLPAEHHPRPTTPVDRRGEMR
jgi:hypothetical protein